MNERRTFHRKLVYFGLIAVLLVPLSLISQPQTSETSGGELAQLRTKENLNPANLGKINPAGEAIRLATLGLRGVAANILWEQANHYKKVEDWEKFGATLEQITVLQPNFVAVWDYQAHNLSYNVSAEFDDYRDRYWWVIRGMNFLIDGTKYNTREMRLTNKVGWFVCQKIGKSDERRQFRKMFFEDKEFNAGRDYNSVRFDDGRQRDGWDNWLVGQSWYLKAQQMVDSGLPLRGHGPSIFHSESAMALINYADTIEKEGIFGAIAKSAWSNALEEWNRFAARDISTPQGLRVRLGQKESIDQQIKEVEEKIDALAPGARKALTQEKLDALSEDEKTARDVDAEKRTSEQARLAYESLAKLVVTNREVVARIDDPEKRAAGQKLERQATRLEGISQAIASQRDIVNYDYWYTRCLSEPEDATLQARENLYNARKAFDKADLVSAQKLYEEGFAKWREILDKYTFLRDHMLMSDDLAREIDVYRRVLGQLDVPFPDPFSLQDVLDIADATDPDRIRQKQEAAARKRAAEEKKAEEKKAAEDQEAKDASADGAGGL